MLIDLPRDILIYILSRVVYAHYVDRYSLTAGISMESNIALLTDYIFHSKYMVSNMAAFIRNLSLVHPRIRALLREHTIIGSSDWIGAVDWIGGPQKYFSALQGGHFNYCQWKSRDDVEDNAKNEINEAPRYWGFNERFFNTLSVYTTGTVEVNSSQYVRCKIY